MFGFWAGAATAQVKALRAQERDEICSLKKQLALSRAERRATEMYRRAES